MGMKMKPIETERTNGGEAGFLEVAQDLELGLGDVLWQLLQGVEDPVRGEEL